MLGHSSLPLCIQHLLVRTNNAESDLLIDRPGRKRGALFEQIRPVNLPLCLEGIERQPLPGEARGKIANGLREVQSVQRKISLRELPLPQPRSKRIHRIVAARDVFCKSKLDRKSTRL